MTIKGYDMRRRMYTLDYPNDEVRRGFVSLMANSYFHTKEVDNENWIIQIDDMLGDFSYTFYIINRLLGCYTTFIEKQNSNMLFHIKMVSEKFTKSE